MPELGVILHDDASLDTRDDLTGRQRVIAKGIEVRDPQIFALPSSTSSTIRTNVALSIEPLLHFAAVKSRR